MRSNTAGAGINKSFSQQIGAGRGSVLTPSSSAFLIAREVILRHGGEALTSRNAFANLSETNRLLLTDFLGALILFPPDDTASTLDPGNRAAVGLPQVGHGSIALTALFNNPADVE